MGVDVLSEISEEELQNFLEPAFRSIIFGEEYDAPTIDEMIETAIITAGTTILFGGSDTVSRDLFANRQLKAIVQTVNNQGSVAINQVDVTKSLRSKGISSQKADGIAEAITARLTGKELNRPQRDILRSALESPTVQSVVSEFMKKKTDGVDSVQKDVYDKENISGGYSIEEAASNKSRNTLPDGILENNTAETENIITDGSHLENGKLKPNVTYKTGEHDYFYTTNEDGVIVNARTDDLQLKEHEGRHKHNPNTYGKEPGDHAGHLFGDRFGGSPELDNLVSQAKEVNWGEYRVIENQWARALKNGQKVTVNIDVKYESGGVRPSSFEVSYTIDGVDYKQIIRN